MDNRIRRNEKCIINLPSCDFVFSSTRSCFIAYGFRESTLEMNILRKLLEHREIEAIEAGREIAPGQYAFCTKICSKIITSQFCIVLLNNEVAGRRKIPNANVNMEYGLMLGFNKYVIPFQRDDHALPFNVAGLDTIKYNNENFESKAVQAIDQAVLETKQDATSTIHVDELIRTFLLSRDVIVTNLDDPGDRNIYELGRPCGFNLLNDFTGLKYIYFGNFPALRAEAIVWRVQKLQALLRDRLDSIEDRIRLRMVAPQLRDLADKFMEGLEIWLLVNGKSEKDTIESIPSKISGLFPVTIFTMENVQRVANELLDIR